MRSNYKMLGDYIEIVSRTNKNLKYGIEDVRGCSNTKQMMQTRANLIGRTYEKFIVLKPKEFVFNRRTTRNGERIGMAYNNTEREYIFTNDYVAFRVRKEYLDVLLPEYLYLFFCRDEFDRYARYKSTGSATEFFNWEDMCAVPFTAPKIDFQQQIVKAYKTITDRIDLKQKIDANLFEQGKTILRHLYAKTQYFGNNTNLDLFCSKIVSGGTPSRTVDEFWKTNDIPWLKNGEIKNNIILSTEEYISKAGLAESSAKLVPIYTVNMAMYCVSDIQVSLSCIPLSTNQAVLNFTTDSYRKACFIYYLLAALGNSITSQANGSAQQNLSKEKIISFEFLEPILSNTVFDFLETNMNQRILIAKEISHLKTMQTILLSRLSR